MKFFISSTLLSLWLCFGLAAEQFLYLSNRTESSIDQYRINTNNGELELVQQFSLNGSPGSFSLSKDEKRLYTTLSNKKVSELATFNIQEGGKLSLKGSHPIKLGGIGIPSHNEGFYFKYNYSKNIVSVLELKDSIHTGKVIQDITTTDHPHDVTFSNDGTLAFVPHNWDNRLYQYRFNSKTGQLEPLEPNYITGPNVEKKGYANFRSMVLHPTQNVFYCTYEMYGGIASLKYDQKGVKLWQEFSSTKHGGQADDVRASRVTISPDSQFLFMSNRIKDAPGSIAVFRLNQQTGEILNKVGVYENPAIRSREVEVDSSGRFLYSSSKQVKSTFLFHINKDGSLRFHKEFKIGGGPMKIIDQLD